RTEALCLRWQNVNLKVGTCAPSTPKIVRTTYYRWVDICGSSCSGAGALRTATGYSPILSQGSGKQTVEGHFSISLAPYFAARWHAANLQWGWLPTTIARKASEKRRSQHPRPNANEAPYRFFRRVSGRECSF